MFYVVARVFLVFTRMFKLVVMVLGGHVHAEMQSSCSV